MILIGVIAASMLQAGASPAQLMPAPPAPASQAAGPLSFDGARFGITVGEWKALAPPLGVGPSAAADCGPGVVAALRAVRIAAATPGAGHATCAYDTRFGDDVLLRSAKLDDRYRIDDLRYRFTNGRLAEIDFTASVDAYNDITAIMTREYGPPAATLRDTLRTPAGRFARVRQTWRAGDGVVSLVDPGDNPLRLNVRITAAGG